MKPEYKIKPWYANINVYNTLTEEEAKEVFEDIQADQTIAEIKEL